MLSTNHENFMNVTNTLWKLKRIIDHSPEILKEIKKSHEKKNNKGRFIITYRNSKWTMKRSRKDCLHLPVLFCFVSCIYYQNMKQNIRGTMLMMLENYCLGFFSVLPNPSLLWRFINISANSLSAFGEKKLYPEDITISYGCSTGFLVSKN